LLDTGDTPSYLKIAHSFPLPYSNPSLLADTIHYPLYPAVVYLTNLLCDNWQVSAYVTIISISALTSVIFYHIANKYSKYALSLSLLFSCFPPKWVQVEVYPLSEPIFMLLLLLAVLMHLNKKYTGCYLALSLLVISRPLGFIFLSSFLIYDIFILKRYSHIALSILATLPFILFHGYLYFLYGKILLFQHAAKAGTWGGKIFSWPLSGLISGLLGSELTIIRKLYTSLEFSIYSLVAITAGRYWRRENLSLFTFIIVPYFAFTLFLKGESHNWWMLSLPRFLFPLAPFGMIYYFSDLKGKYSYPALVAVAALLSFAYVAGSHYLHLKYGAYV